MADSDDARPARENRLLSDRSERAVIPIRTRFAYRTPSGAAESGLLSQRHHRLRRVRLTHTGIQPLASSGW